MSRVTSLTSMPEAQLNRWIKRIGLLLIIGIVAFAAYYAIDRFRAPAAPIADQQLVALEEAVRQDPADIASRGKLADIYVAKGRYPEAIAQYTSIVESGKDIELAKYGRARAYLLSDQLDLAKADYLAVVDIAKGGEMAGVDPMLEGAYYGLGDIAMRQSQPAEAVAHLESALKINRSDADALLLIGKAYTQTGQADRAELALKRAVLFVPIGWVEPYQALVDAYTKAGKTEQAEWAAAMVAFQSGEVDAAVTRLTALVDGKAALDALIGLGLIAETRGQLADARGWYQKALAIDPADSAATLGLGRAGSGATPGPVATPAPSLPFPGGSGGNS